MIVVTGSRAWTDRELIRERLAQLPPTTVVLHGGARGADSIAGQIARELGLPVDTMRADWTVKPDTPPWRTKRTAGGQLYDSQAGFDRNQAMIDRRPSLVLAFADDLDEAPGTSDCITRALRAGIVVEHHTHTGARLLGETQVALF